VSVPVPSTGIEVDLGQTLGSALESAAAADPGRAFLRFPAAEVTTGQLEERSRRMAGLLRSWGVGRGDRVAIMMGNAPEFVEAWFGIVRLGAVEVPVHIAYQGPQIEHVLAESGATVLLCDAAVAERLRGVDAPALRTVVVRGATTLELPGAEVLDHAEVVAGASPVELPVLRGDDVSCLLYTSGTTGRSKGVVLSHSANLHLAKSNIHFMEWGPRDVLYTAFPLFHVSAKFTSVVASLLCGGRLVIDERFSASRFWDTMREHGVTGFNSMGSMLTMLYNQAPRDDDREHEVDRCYGAACPPQLWEKFQDRFGVRIREHYGMTEIGIATYNREGRVGSCGKPAPWFELRLADEEDRPVAPGETGEIQVRPNLPGIMLSEYWERPDATTEALRNLWFHTGDRARQDADGYVYFVDRAKDCIRRRGENISSFEVESVVNQFEPVAESAAFAVPSELGEDEVMVAVVPHPGAHVDLDALIAHCEQRLAGFAVPRYVRFVDELPKTASQRIQKFALREVGVTGDTHDRIGARTAQA
jgi:crotonobetaine/carnitine-CoA ligase